VHKFFSILLVVALLGLGVVLGYSFYVQPGTQDGVEEEQIFCTLEAKICPDGSAVGREGPNCEFAACPGEVMKDVSGWKTYRNEEYGFQFMYPENPPANGKYQYAYNWPPRVEVEKVNSNFACQASGSGPGVPVYTSLTVNGKPACITVQSEGAAGSVYSTVEGVIDNGYRTTIEFVYRAVNCGVFDQAQKEFTECSEGLSTSPIELMKQVIETYKFVDSVDASGWKTYRNEEYRFQFQYPSETSISVSEEGRRVCILGITEIASPCVRVKDILSSTLKTLSETWINYQHTDDYGDVVVGGVPGFWYTTTEMGQYIVLVADSDYLYEFTTFGLWEKDGVIDTFKFIK